MITLFDLSAEFWRNYYATKSAVEAYQNTIDKCQHYDMTCERFAVMADSPRCKRYDYYPEYKANRIGSKPQDAIDSLDGVKDQLTTLGLEVVECEGYEADDLMATLAKQAWPEDVQLITRDKDMYQLISESCWLVTRDGIIGIDECFQKFGVKPHQIRDFLALTGDVADNIPGCPSCGLGRARDLLNRFGTIKGIQAATDEEILSVRKVGLKTLTELRAWDPTLAVKLVTLLDDAPVNLEDLWAA
jgi:DNA polymerase-1